jgi:hypothetical protein
MEETPHILERDLREFATTERELRIIEGQIAQLQQQQARLRTGNEARILRVISERKLLADVYLVRTVFSSKEWVVLLEPQDDARLSALIPYFYRDGLALVSRASTNGTDLLSLRMGVPGAKLILFTSTWHWAFHVDDWKKFIPFMEQEGMYLSKESVDDLMESVSILQAHHVGKANEWELLISHLKQ